MKRVAIGVELLDEASVMILDEPTSGLDGNLSVKIVELLLKEARKGRTIIATIHQPSSQVNHWSYIAKSISIYLLLMSLMMNQVFEMFDRFLLISHGQVVYHGAADRALPYFANLGHVAHKDWNPSDFLLDLVSDHPASYNDGNNLDGNNLEVSDAMTDSSSPKHLNETERLGLTSTWRESVSNKELMHEIEVVEAEMGGQPRYQNPNRSRKSHWGHEVITLWKRTSRNSIRNPLTAIVTLLVQIMQGLVLGGIFFHLAKVGPGPKPKPLLDLDFWNNEWTLAYIHGVGSPRTHPFVEMFEKGVDGKGSYIFGNLSSPLSEFQFPVHWSLDHVVTCLYNKPELDMGGLKYPQLTDMRYAAANSWDEWTPRRVYSNLMAAYQIFDRQWATENHIKDGNVMYWQFFKECKIAWEVDKDDLSFYICVMQKGKKTVDPLVTCADLLPLPTTGSRALQGSDSSDSAVCADGRCSQNVVNQSDSLNFNNESTESRKLMSIGGAIGMDKAVADLLGEDLTQIVDASTEWVRRLTSCNNPICDNIKEFTDFFKNWTMSTIDTIAAVLNFSGCLFFVVSVLGFSSYDALLTFPQERALFNRESANGLYRPSSYYVAKNIADLPFQMVPCMVMATIFYLMVGFDFTARQYFTYFIICVLTTFCAYGFGYMVSAGAPRMELAILIAPLTLVIWLTLAGFFLRDGDVPLWINWFKYLSFYRWAFFALVTNQFPPGGYFGTLPNSVHLALSGVTETNLAVSVALLLILGVAYRLLGFIFLTTTNRRVGLEA